MLGNTTGQQLFLSRNLWFTVTKVVDNLPNQMLDSYLIDLITYRLLFPGIFFGLLCGQTPLIIVDNIVDSGSLSEN